MTMLREQHCVTPMLMPVVSNLMKPHLDIMELRMRPGEVTSTWTSMDIDSYIRTVWRELRRLDKFITPVNDVVENRIDANLKNVFHVLLMDIPEENHLKDLEGYVEIQEGMGRTASHGWWRRTAR